MHTSPYEKGTIQFSLPAGMRISQAVSKPVCPLENEITPVVEALAHPIDTPPLREMILAAAMGDALQIATGQLGASCDVLIVPHAMLTPPVVQEKQTC